MIRYLFLFAVLASCTNHTQPQDTKRQDFVCEPLSDGDITIWSCEFLKLKTVCYMDMTGPSMSCVKYD